jgi:SAM-dependent methyltransferase
MLQMTSESQQIKERYSRRSLADFRGRYDFVNPAVYLSLQERERALICWIRECGIRPVRSRRVLEIGCGGGYNLLDLLRFGFQPGNLVGNELLPERAQVARGLLPEELSILAGDAMDMQLPAASFDVVLQSTVFTSILDREFQNELAARMWEWAKPGGGVLWYDFIYNNPRNPDVAGVPLRRIRELFPDGRLRYWRVTLAPPLARLVTRVHPAFYGAANCFPFLRTHVLCWIQKGGRP